MEILTQILERWGFPTAFAAWLMLSVSRELREIRALLQKQSVVNAVILKTLDVAEAVDLSAGHAIPQAINPTKGA
jgi:hypothetical protein